MKTPKDQKPLPTALRSLYRLYQMPTQVSGNTLLYILVLLVIFSVLGTTMVSLFTTSATSSATPNDARRALYIAESGIRYALSEIRNSKSVEYAAEKLNTTSEFKLGKNGNFKASVFSSGMLSADTGLKSAGDILTLDVPYSGKFPSDFNIPDVYIVSWSTFKGLNPQDKRSAAFTVSDQRESEVDLTLGDNYEADLKDVSFALLTTDAGTFPEGGSIYVAEEANEFFPVANGAIRILNLSEGKHYDVIYETLEHDQSNSRVKLNNLKKLPGASWEPVTAMNVADYVILSPANFRVFATGKSDEIEVTIGNNIPIWATRLPTGYTIYMHELIDDSNINQFGDVIRKFGAGEKKIELGPGSDGSEGFGDLWYSGDKAIGGDTARCKTGRCIFNEGIRAFFTARLSGDGEGFTFALIGGGNTTDTIIPVNTAVSAGGDVDASELLGYAGDSRTDPAGTTFVDSYILTQPPGLLPPKMALEFDTRTNLNEPLQYCSGSDLNENTRNDPMPEGNAKDVMQYVFWGNELLAISCRGGSQTYDDNRHNAEGGELSQNWTFRTGGAISLGRPAIASDGSVYMSAMDATLNRFLPDGTLTWVFDLTDNNDYAPGIDRTGGPHDGTIYSDISGNSLVAINPDGTEKWRVDIGSDFDSTPAVGPDGSIYFGTDSDKIIKLNPDDRDAGLTFPNSTDGREWIFDTGGEVDTSPALSPDGSVVYAVSNDDNLYAVNTSTGLEEWRFPILTEPNEINSSPTVNPSDGTIYVGADDNIVYAIDPLGGIKWGYITGNEVESTAGLDPNDGTIYIGSDDSKLHAIKPDGNSKGLSWPFSTGSMVVSSPIVGSDGIVFFGSEDNNVYAVDPDGIKKWEFPTGGIVQSSPALDADGFVLIGSNDNNFYSIASVSVPRNYRTDHPDFYQVPTSPIDYRDDYIFSQNAFLIDKDIEAGADIDVENDWLNGGSFLYPWAVRMEVEKVAPLTYKLSTWIRQCSIGDCSDIKDTLFQDTERKYDYSPLTYPSSTIKRQPMVQTIKLSGGEDEQFERILFGFTTGAKSGDTQLIEIRDFQLTFIEASREEAAVINDPNWP